MFKPDFSRQFPRLALTRYNCGWKDGIGNHVRDKPLSCVILGVRQADVSSEQLETLMPSSPWLGHDVKFIRSHPIKDWVYQDVWT